MDSFYQIVMAILSYRVDVELLPASESKVITTVSREAKLFFQKPKGPLQNASLGILKVEATNTRKIPQK